MKEIEINIENDEVQKLNLYDVIDYILNLDKETQIRILKILSNDLKLTNITKAKNILGISYNGVKDHRDTIQISGKNFAVLKE